MHTALVRHSWIVVPLLALIAAPSAQAQFSALDLRYKAGVSVPLNDFGEYFNWGPRFGVDVGYPFRDRLGLVLALDWDQVNNAYSYVPDTRRWRYQAGVEASLLGGPTSSARLAGYLGAGATSFRSKEFYIVSRGGESRRISRTHPTGTGGLRLAFEPDPGFVWWLSGDFNWTPMADEDTQALREATLDALQPFSSATDLAITLGLSVRP